MNIDNLDPFLLIDISDKAIEKVKVTDMADNISMDRIKNSFDQGIDQRKAIMSILLRFLQFDGRTSKINDRNFIALKDKTVYTYGNIFEYLGTKLDYLDRGFWQALSDLFNRLISPQTAYDYEVLIKLISVPRLRQLLILYLRTQTDDKKQINRNNQDAIKAWCVRNKGSAEWLNGTLDDIKDQVANLAVDPDIQQKFNEITKTDRDIQLEAEAEEGRVKAGEEAQRSAELTQRANEIVTNYELLIQMQNNVMRGQQQVILGVQQIIQDNMLDGQANINQGNQILQAQQGVYNIQRVIGANLQTVSIDKLPSDLQTVIKTHQREVQLLETQIQTQQQTVQMAMMQLMLWQQSHPVNPPAPPAAAPAQQAPQQVPAQPVPPAQKTYPGDKNFTFDEFSSDEPTSPEPVDKPEAQTVETITALRTQLSQLRQSVRDNLQNETEIQEKIDQYILFLNSELQRILTSRGDRTELFQEFSEEIKETVENLMAIREESKNRNFINSLINELLTMNKVIENDRPVADAVGPRVKQEPQYSGIEVGEIVEIADNLVSILLLISPIINGLLEKEVLKKYGDLKQIQTFKGYIDWIIHNKEGFEENLKKNIAKLSPKEQQDLKKKLNKWSRKKIQIARNVAAIKGSLNPATLVSILLESLKFVYDFGPFIYKVIMETSGSTKS